LSYWETALGFVAGLPEFPAYFFVALGLNGEPVPEVILAGVALGSPVGPLFPMEAKEVGLQLERTFEPVCPGAAVAAAGLVGPGLVGGWLWRSVAKATRAERANRQIPIVREGMGFFISELLDSRTLEATDTDFLCCPYS
jgi:hypothetical protein